MANSECKPIAASGGRNGIKSVSRTLRAVVLVATFVLVGSTTAYGQSTAPAFVVMGDSVGEGVQAADAAWQTQIFSYATWVGYLRGSPPTYPWIKTNIFGIVGETSGRTRLKPSDVGTNVAVSGARVATLLDRQADAQTTTEIDSETDLVLFPRLESQMEAVETAPPKLILCWIGNNDALSAATSFGSLDASQLTPLDEFDADFVRLADRLEQLINNHDTRVVFANIPALTDIAFLLDRAAAEAITGFPVGLPDGSATSLPTAILMSLFGNDALIDLPDFVLDPDELEIIRARISDFNSVIAREAGRLGMPVVDINAKFREFVTNPPVIDGFSLTNRPFGGLFSSDGVHPSNTAHALIANEFITTINNSFNESTPLVPNAVLSRLFQTDPHIDKDGDGRVAGRPGVGLLETVSLLIGLSGDFGEL